MDRLSQRCVSFPSTHKKGFKIFFLLICIKFYFLKILVVTWLCHYNIKAACCSSVTVQFTQFQVKFSCLKRKNLTFQLCHRKKTRRLYNSSVFCTTPENISTQKSIANWEKLCKFRHETWIYTPTDSTRLSKIHLSDIWFN
jgi:hypothetical protein